MLCVGIGHAFQAGKVSEGYRPLEQTRGTCRNGRSSGRESPDTRPRVLAAVGPRMLELSRDQVDGAHPFAQPLRTPGWKRLSYTDSDIADTSDRLANAFYAWGDEEAIVKRVRGLFDSGADHVLVSPVGDGPESIVEQLERLAPAFAEVTRERRNLDFRLRGQGNQRRARRSRSSGRPSTTSSAGSNRSNA